MEVKEGNARSSYFLGFSQVVTKSSAAVSASDDLFICYLVVRLTMVMTKKK